MAETSPNIFVLHADTARAFAKRVIECAPGVYVFPLSSLLFGRLRGAKLIERASSGTVKKISFRGIASPAVLGAPLFSYFLLLTFGLLTLSTPALVSFELEPAEAFDLEALKRHIVNLIEANPNQYTRIPSEQLIRRIQASASFDQLATSLGRD